MRNTIRPEHWVASMRVRLDPRRVLTTSPHHCQMAETHLKKGVLYTIIKTELLRHTGEVLVALDLPDREAGSEMLFFSSTLFLAECDQGEEEGVSTFRQLLEWLKLRFRRTAGA